jgi:hypothetical protein
MLYLTQEDSSRPSLTLEEYEELYPELAAKPNVEKPDTPKKKFSFHVPKAAECEATFRHSGWKAKRDVVYRALKSAGSNAFALDRFAQCGSGCVVEYSPSLKKERLKACYCHSRHCEPCMRAKANKMAANLRNRLKLEPDGRYRFVTLTLRHTATPLIDQIDRLYAAFKKLRKSRYWSETQRGGAAALEVKWEPKARRWHPHLHVISEGEFLHKDALCNAWHRATGDSYIADIRRLDSAADAAHYVSKYVTKGCNSDVWQDLSVAQEWILSTKGVRMATTYGTWRGYRLLQSAESADDWRETCTLVELYAAINKGEEWAIGMLCRLTEKRLHHEAAATPQLALYG